MDYENNLYYLMSRFYNPSIARFISSDKIEYLDASIASGLNLYAYCLNDPVNNSDQEGTSVIGWFILTCLLVAAIYISGHMIYSVAGKEKLKNSELQYNRDEDSDIVTFNYGDEMFSAIYTKDNWKITDSYKIRNYNDMVKICDVLNSIHNIPGRKGGVRTSKDMAFEWVQHNHIYYWISPFNLSYEENVQSVDFDSNDQGKTFIRLSIERIFRR